MHYYQFNIGDYASHTRHLTLIEDIAYRRLLDAYYLHERPLIDCLTTVARQINMRDYENEVEAVLIEFFEHTDDGWISRRADREIAHYRSKIEQASKAGKASAERRLNARSTDVQPTNNHKPITNNHISNDRFDEFYKVYPKKVAKEQAIKAWKKIKPNDELFDKIIKSIKSQGLADRDKQFVPNPATWLNGKRWEDEVTVKQYDFDPMLRRAK